MTVLQLQDHLQILLINVDFRYDVRAPEAKDFKMPRAGTRKKKKTPEELAAFRMKEAERLRLLRCENYHYHTKLDN